MIDVTVFESLTLATSEDQSGGVNKEESSFEKLKKIFARAVKRAIHRDSTISIPCKLPYFIAFVGLCEVLMHFFASKSIRDAFIYTPRKKCDLWRFVTYMLLHNDFVHLVLNIIIQSFLAAPLELEQGHVRTAAVYFGGGLAGSLGASVFDNDSKLVGASGGIYALLISQISHIILNHRILKYVLYRSIAVFLLALADIVYICYHIYVFNNENPRISLAAHFAGALSGFLLGALFYNGTVHWRNSFRVITAVFVFLLVISVKFLCVHIFMFYEVNAPGARHWPCGRCYPVLPVQHVSKISEGDNLGVEKK